MNLILCNILPLSFCIFFCGEKNPKLFGLFTFLSTFLYEMFNEDNLFIFVIKNQEYISFKERFDLLHNRVGQGT